MTHAISPQNATLPTLTSAAQDKALGALLSGATVTAAAKAAAVDRATLHRWLSDDPVFIAAYNSYRAEMMDAVRQELRFLAAEAVKAMRAVLADGAAPPAVRVRAAGEVLKLVLAERPPGPTDVEGAKRALRKREMFRMLGGV